MSVRRVHVQMLTGAAVVTFELHDVPGQTGDRRLPFDLDWLVAINAVVATDFGASGIPLPFATNR
jgi:hypothetical protein